MTKHLVVVALVLGLQLDHFREHFLCLLHVALCERHVPITTELRHALLFLAVDAAREKCEACARDKHELAQGQAATIPHSVLSS